MVLVGMGGILIQSLVGKQIKEIARAAQNVHVVFEDDTVADFEWRDGLLFFKLADEPVQAKS